MVGYSETNSNGFVLGAPGGACPRQDLPANDAESRQMPSGWWLPPVLLLSVAAWGPIFRLVFG